MPTLERLSQFQSDDRGRLSLALATNSDSRILSCSRASAGPLPSARCQHFISRPCCNINGTDTIVLREVRQAGFRFFHAAIRRNTGMEAKLEAANVLYVGDQLHEDFWGATDAGLQAAWLQRSSGRESNQPFQQVRQERNSEQQRAYVRERTVSSLSDLVDIVTQSHN